MTLVGRAVAVTLVLASAGMLAFSVVSVAGPATTVMAERPTALTYLVGGTVILAFLVVGSVVAWRRPTNPVGWLLLLGGVWVATGAFATEYAGRIELPGRAVVGWVGQLGVAAGMSICMPLAIFLFPDGRSPSEWWRRAMLLAVGVASIVTIAAAAAPGEMFNVRLTNPLGAPGLLGELATATYAQFGILVLLPTLVTVAATAMRFRSAEGALRQQMKWLVYPVGLFVCGMAAGIATELEWVFTAALLGLAAVPIVVAIAILRYRLYDIDIIIRRTLVYGALTAVLGAVYVAGVLVLQAALSPFTEGNALAVAASTLAVAALFRPARGRIQQIVDRRFYRSRYDAARTIEGFSARLRDQVDLASLRDELQTVVETTMRPASASVWMRPRRLR